MKHGPTHTSMQRKRTRRILRTITTNLRTIPAGRVTSDIAPNGTSNTSYYSDGSIQLATDATGVKTYYTYNRERFCCNHYARLSRIARIAFRLRLRYEFYRKSHFHHAKEPINRCGQSGLAGMAVRLLSGGKHGSRRPLSRLSCAKRWINPRYIATYTYNSAGQVLTVTDATGRSNNLRIQCNDRRSNLGHLSEKFGFWCQSRLPVWAGRCRPSQLGYGSTRPCDKLPLRQSRSHHIGNASQTLHFIEPEFYNHVFL